MPNLSWPQAVVSRVRHGAHWRCVLACGCWLLGMAGGGWAAVEGKIDAGLNGNSLTAHDIAQWNYFAGQLADMSGDYDLGLAYYQKALALDPNSETLRMSMTTDLIRLDRFQEARLASLPLVDKKHKDYKTSFILGQLHEAFGNTRLAEALYREAMALNPENTHAQTKLGILLLRQEKIREAIPLFRASLAINPDEREARRMLVRYYWSKQDLAAVERELQIALQMEPEDLEWLGDLADLRNQQGHKEEAAEYYSQLAQTHPDAPEGHRFLSNYYLQKGDWQGAVEQLEKLLALEPKDSMAQRNLGLAWYKLSDWDQAAEQLRPLIEAGGADSLTYYLMATIYYHKGRFYLAVDAYRTAIQKNPELVEGYLGLAACLERIEKSREAEVVLREAHSRFPRLPEVQMRYGLVLLETKQPRAARQVFQTAHELEPKSGEILFHLGRAYMALGEFEQAAMSWQQAVQLEPRLADAYNYLGYTHAERGLRLDQAVAWIKKALEIDPQNGYYLDSLGWAYYKQRDYVRALRELLNSRDQLLAKGQKVDKIIFDHIGDVYFALRQMSEAIAAWQEALVSDPADPLINEKIRNAKHSEGVPAP